MPRLMYFAACGVLLLTTCSSNESDGGTDGDLVIDGPASVEMTTMPGNSLVGPGTNGVPSTTTATTTTTGAATTTSAAPGNTGSPTTTTSSQTASTTSAPSPGPAPSSGPIDDNPGYDNPGYDSPVYSDPSHWLCSADLDDICDEPYSTTDVAADGSLTEIPATVASASPVDCFYVYPTVSGDATFNSDLVADNEIPATQHQAARFNQVCTVYAPLYRSVTSAGLSDVLRGGVLGGSLPPSGSEQFRTGWRMAYNDVLDAWRHYLANFNNGRPVAILAHSQGSFHVITLLREEIDPDPAQRALVVSAIITGTSFQVAPGRDVGGDTQNMPLCRRDDQFGCVITFQTYRDDVPPTEGALFGRPGPATESACVNPGALVGGAAPLEGSYPAGPWVFADVEQAAPITTPRVGLPGLVTGECKERAGYNYLAVTIEADPGDPRTDDIPGDGAPNWGLHTIDMNVAQDTLIDLVASQSTAWLAQT